MAKPDFSTVEENVVCKTEDRAYILKVTNENIDFPLFVWILLYQDLENKGLLGENELFQAVIICRSLINRQGGIPVCLYWRHLLRKQKARINQLFSVSKQLNFVLP